MSEAPPLPVPLDALAVTARVLAGSRSEDDVREMAEMFGPMRCGTWTARPGNGRPPMAPSDAAALDAWHAARARVVGASEVAALFGVSPHTSHWSLW